MPEDYPVSQMMADILAVVQDNMVYIVPAALFIGSIAFVIAWFTDTIDLAGKTFGRHR